MRARNIGDEFDLFRNQVARMSVNTHKQKKCKREWYSEMHTLTAMLSPLSVCLRVCVLQDERL